jgi:hypothetical protein
VVPGLVPGHNVPEVGIPEGVPDGVPESVHVSPTSTKKIIHRPSPAPPFLSEIGHVSFIFVIPAAVPLLTDILSPLPPAVAMPPAD